MTNKRSWLEKMARRSADKNDQIEDQANNTSILPRSSAFLQWLTWKKGLLILLTLPWGMLAILYGFFYIVEHSTLFPYSATIEITNQHRRPLWISYVGIDGRRLSDRFGSYEQGLGEMADKGMTNTARLTSGNLFQWEMQSGQIAPNKLHKLVLHVHDPLSSAKKIYSCELIVPRSDGKLAIDLNEHSKMSCEYSVYQYISIWE
jgi:hypothetical protein